MAQLDFQVSFYFVLILLVLVNLSLIQIFIEQEYLNYKILNKNTYLFNEFIKNYQKAYNLR